MSDVMRLQAQINELQAQVKYLLSLEQPGGWTNYGATSTVVGWSATTIKNIYYRQVGDLVFVSFYISGTSDSTSTTFTLPYTAATQVPQVIIRTADNGGAAAAGYINLTNGSATVNCYPAVAGTANWTASGTKYIIGEFWYKKS